MDTKKYDSLWSTISLLLRQIIAVQSDHDFAMLDEKDFQKWKQFDCFLSEDGNCIICNDGTIRLKSITYFEDGEHVWEMSSIKCPNSDPNSDQAWRYIEYVKFDDEEVSRSKIPVEEFSKIASERTSS